MSFGVLEPKDAAWPRLLRTVPHDIYHLPGYARVCDVHEPQPTRLAVASSGAHTLVMPFMLRELPNGVAGNDVTVPYGYPGPVCSSAEPLIQETLMAELLGGFADMGAISVFMRCHPFLGVRLPVLERHGDVVVHGDQVYLDLAAVPEAVEESFRPGHRHDIARLRRAGFEIRVNDDRDADAFPALYDRNMQRLEADPYYHFSRAYFDEIRSALGDNTHYVAAISPEGDTAAIALLFVCGNIGQYHLACTEDAFLRLAPSKLTIVGMAEVCRGLGATILNLGGGVGGHHDSLLEFKAGFSPCRKPFATARIVLDHTMYDALAESACALPGFFPAYRGGL